MRTAPRGVHPGDRRSPRARGRGRAALGRVTPRTILYTGKGGVGKTSVAAATARRLARGRAPHADRLDRPRALARRRARRRARRPSRGPSPTASHAQQVVAQAEMERHWAAVQDWLGELLVRRGIDRISAEELTVPPGLDELFSLLEIRRHHDEGDYEAIVVDCAPTGETLRLLSFPDVARWWLEKAFPQHSRMVAAARPFARALPDERVLDEVQRPAAQPDRDERGPARPRARQRAARADAREARDRRGAAHVHLPLALRLPDRRGDRQPRAARRGRRLLRPLARAPGRADARGRARASRPVPRAERAVLRRGGASAPRCSTGSAPSCSRTPIRPRCCTTGSRRS